MSAMQTMGRFTAIILLPALIGACSQQESPANTPDTWESYLYGIIENREESLLYAQKAFEINLDEYIAEGKLSILSSPTEIEPIANNYESAYLIDIDHDGVDELYVITSEGSIRQHYGNVFTNKEDTYVLEDTFEGNIMPVTYNNEVHFISIEYDFESKLESAVIEYSVDGLAFKPQQILDISYVYDLSSLHGSMADMINNEDIQSLSSYEAMSSNAADITQTSEQPSYAIEVTDDKYGNTFHFNLELWLTTVGYAPNEWRISAADDRTSHFKGMAQVVTADEDDADGPVNYGFRWYKDDTDQLFMLKITYPFYTTKAREDGDLDLELFKFNRDSVERVEKVRNKPEVTVRAEVPNA